MQQRVEMRLAAIALVVLGLWVAAVARQRWLLSSDILATESAPVASAAGAMSRARRQRRRRLRQYTSGVARSRRCRVSMSTHQSWCPWAPR
jgi:hypothetical protein